MSAKVIKTTYLLQVIFGRLSYTMYVLVYGGKGYSKLTNGEEIYQIAVYREKRESWTEKIYLS
jgi:hypothetical protein